MTLLQREWLNIVTYLPPGSLCLICYRKLRCALLLAGPLKLRQRTFTGLFRWNMRCMTLFPLEVLTFRSMTSSWWCEFPMLPVHSSCRHWVTLDESSATNCLVLLSLLGKLGAELLVILLTRMLRRNTRCRVGGSDYIVSSSLSDPVVPVSCLVIAASDLTALTWPAVSCSIPLTCPLAPLDPVFPFDPLGPLAPLDPLLFPVTF